jgi:hypothetical protein
MHCQNTLIVFLIIFPALAANRPYGGLNRVDAGGTAI